MPTNYVSVSLLTTELTSTLATLFTYPNYHKCKYISTIGDMPLEKKSITTTEKFSWLKENDDLFYDIS